jgi:hypothetical protein
MKAKKTKTSNVSAPVLSPATLQKVARYLEAFRRDQRRHLHKIEGEAIRAVARDLFGAKRSVSRQRDSRNSYDLRLANSDALPGAYAQLRETLQLLGVLRCPQALTPKEVEGILRSDGRLPVPLTLKGQRL